MDIPPCPAGSWPLSLSTWNGGWLLVCGTSASEPTSLTYSDAGGTGEASSVQAAGTGYCGQASVGQVCVYRVPAMVRIGDVQRSVPDNYFTSHGRGGAGEGDGSYNVPAPQASAQDQVRYLVDILNRSKNARTALGPASQNVMNCKNLSSAVSQIDGITQNRRDLLAALDSTPVDLISGGSQIVAQLRSALEASRDADIAWANWGRSRQTNGCSSTGKVPTAVLDAEKKVNAAKATFCATWKTQIADVYGVHAFTSTEI